MGFHSDGLTRFSFSPSTNGFALLQYVARCCIIGIDYRRGPLDRVPVSWLTGCKICNIWPFAISFTVSRFGYLVIFFFVIILRPVSLRIDFSFSTFERNFESLGFAWFHRHVIKSTARWRESRQKKKDAGCLRPFDIALRLLMCKL